MLPEITKIVKPIHVKGVSQYFCSYSACMCVCVCVYTHTILPKVLGNPHLMKGLTTLVISMSTNLNV